MHHYLGIFIGSLFADSLACPKCKHPIVKSIIAGCYYCKECKKTWVTK